MQEVSFFPETIRNYTFSTDVGCTVNYMDIKMNRKSKETLLVSGGQDYC